MSTALKQNTPEWSALRQTKIGASDAPIIMKLSKFKTPYQLWEEKTGLIKKIFEPSPQTERGHNLEEIARQHYAAETGFQISPRVVYHPEHDFLMASLDGWHEPSRLVVEVKCPGQDDHKLALKGILPAHYFPQVQHQMACADADFLHYYSFDGQDGVIVHCKRDSEYINNSLLPALFEFRQNVAMLTPPDLTDKDYKKSQNYELCHLVSQYLAFKEQADQLDKTMGDLKDQIFKLTTHSRMAIGRARLIQSYRAGNVDYSKVPELAGVDLDQYRKAPILTKSIRLSKDEV